MSSGGRKTSRSQKKAGKPRLVLGRPLLWIGSSKDDISRMPSPVKASFGYRLRRIQKGLSAADAKALSQFGKGVFELREAYDTNAYRVVYVVALEKGVYVLHAFIKKSKSGIGLPKPDVNLIQARFKRAQELDAENDNG